MGELKAKLEQGERLDVTVAGRVIPCLVELDSGENERTGGRSMLLIAEHHAPDPPMAVHPERGVILLLLRDEKGWRELAGNRPVEIEAGRQT